MKIKVFILTLFFFSITVEPDCNSTASIPKHKTENKISKFDMAVELIKQKEGWHDRRHKYYVGYGHRLLKSDTFNHDISEEFADSLLRKDLLQKCSVFRKYGKDSLLLSEISDNNTESRPNLLNRRQSFIMSARRMESP